MNVKQTPVTIRLRDLMEEADGWGTPAGRRLHDRLLSRVEEHPGSTIFQISLEGVQRTDASFPRESVMEIARRFRAKKAFFLSDIDDPDLLDNWDAAAHKKEQPILVVNQGGYRLLGSALSEGTRPLFDLVLATQGMTTAEVAAKLNQSVPNVSNKLKTLWETGYVMRSENVAPSGGIEFEYFVAH